MRLVCSSTHRSAMATLWAIAILSVLGLISIGMINYLATDLKMVRHAEYQMQAQALAQGGLELAIERFLRDPRNLQLESPRLLEKSSLEIKIHPVRQNDQIQVRVEARYPTDSQEAYTAILERRLRRTVEGGKVKITLQPVVPSAHSQPKSNK